MSNYIVRVSEGAGTRPLELRFDSESLDKAKVTAHTKACDFIAGGHDIIKWWLYKAEYDWKTKLIVLGSGETDYDDYLRIEYHDRYIKKGGA